jgi:hypothetical protein
MVCLVVACHDNARTPGAGNENVAVVENTAQAWSAEEAWRIEAAPMLSIGRVDGPAEYQLHRVTRALRLGDGTIVVANGGTSQIRFYDATGKHTHSAGGRGSGPGEFQALQLLRRFGPDSLIAWDGRLNRGTVLALDGTYGRTVSRPGIGGAIVFYVDAFADGSLLGVGPGYRAGRLPGSAPVEVEVQRVSLQSGHQGPQADTALLFRLRPNGQIDTIGGFFYYELYTSGTTTTEMPFGRWAATAASGDLLYYGSGETFEIRTYTSRGELKRITRIDRANPPLTRDRIDEFIERRVSGTSDPIRRSTQRMFFEAVPYPRSLPAFSEFVVDAEGNLWASEYHEFMAAQPRWTVFDRHGRWLGSVDAPPSFTTYEIGSDYVLGKFVDELDVERVVVHRLMKQTEAPGSR